MKDKDYLVTGEPRFPTMELLGVIAIIAFIAYIIIL